MKTVVLDDDPTGTQSATAAKVLLQYDSERIAAALTDAESVYLQTNSRAIDEASAVELMKRIKTEVAAAAGRLGVDVQVIMRGDSTLRGHVFAEAAQLLEEQGVILFVPAFPEGGRITRDGIHLLRIDGAEVPMSETEYARDPVFPFQNSRLIDYVAEKSGRPAVSVPLADLRVRGRLAAKLQNAEPGSVVIPDAVTDDDIRLIADESRLARQRGASILVRSSAPLAANLAGVASTGLLTAPLSPNARSVLVVCGSHTSGATRQLARIRARSGAPVVISTAAALADPVSAGSEAAIALQERMSRQFVTVLETERDRSGDHGTLDHGERVMQALTTAVSAVRPDLDVVIAKGGITSAEVAHVGLGADEAIVLGQILPGVSVWRLVVDERPLIYVVVPGNVGDNDTLQHLLDAVITSL
ncbi:four-carbon acid sugar kinase family protein [uncultured Leifsonia sp.]|uniref:four-carbon acid sugar kinase family protein n=1 Tax=uncultured Leifsonia sp. TaxID=340359 RepID=UPI0025D3F74E|nr:four-carbon acid sugar kinase family protein [uncultured Leifsonia sp.]